MSQIEPPQKTPSRCGTFTHRLGNPALQPGEEKRWHGSGFDGLWLTGPGQRFIGAIGIADRLQPRIGDVARGADDSKFRHQRPALGTHAPDGTKLAVIAHERDDINKRVQVQAKRAANDQRKITSNAIHRSSPHSLRLRNVCGLLIKSGGNGAVITAPVRTNGAIHAGGKTSRNQCLMHRVALKAVNLGDFKQRVAALHQMHVFGASAINGGSGPAAHGCTSAADWGVV